MDCYTHITERKILFQGGRSWPGNWREANSRVVHGISYCRLDSYESSSLSEFHGWIDRQSLDSAGFAAVHTIAHTNTWNLSEYDALEIRMGNSDGKVYTISLEDGRSVGWEGTFRAPGKEGPTPRVIRFDNLVPVQRKRERVTRPLNLENIKQFGIWIRSHDGIQEGAFSLNIYAICAVKLPCSCSPLQDLILVTEREAPDEDSTQIKTPLAASDLGGVLTRYMVKGKKTLLVTVTQVNRHMSQQVNEWMDKLNEIRNENKPKKVI